MESHCTAQAVQGAAPRADERGMPLSAVGTCMCLAGYALAIVGGSILYWYAAPDVGRGLVPRISGSEAKQFFERQDREMARRARANPIGFALLTLGSVLQLAGTALSASWTWHTP
jgi:hypothetical protein